MGRPPTPVGTAGRVNVSQIAPGRFVARTRYRDDDGVSRKVEAAGSTAAAATRALKTPLVQRRAAVSDEITGTTRLSVVLDRWLAEEVDDGRRAANTRLRYREVVTLHIAPRIGALLVREATVPRLERFVREVTVEVGAPSAKVARTCLAGALAVAVRHGALAVNPVREVSSPRIEHREVRAPSPEQIRALRVDLAADPRAAAVDLPALVDVLLGTGARIGEALALRWSDVDVAAGTVALTGTVVRVRHPDRPGALIRQDTTKGHRPRAQLLPTFALAALAAQRERGLPGGEHDLVFPSAAATLREVATVEKQFRGFKSRHSRWSDVTFHSFRRAVGTAVERGAGMAVAAAVLGHSSPAVTARHYVERAPLGPDVTTVLDAFSDVLDGFPASQIRTDPKAPS